MHLSFSKLLARCIEMTHAWLLLRLFVILILQELRTSSWCFILLYFSFFSAVIGSTAESAESERRNAFRGTPTAGTGRWMYSWRLCICQTWSVWGQIWRFSFYIPFHICKDEYSHQEREQETIMESSPVQDVEGNLYGDACSRGNCPYWGTYQNY